MQILLIEDTPTCARDIKAELLNQGHEVTWIIGALSVEPQKLVGILPSPEPEKFRDRWNGQEDRLIEIDLSTVKFVLCDQELIVGPAKSPINSGAQIVPSLVSNGATVVGISSVSHGNALLTAAGAQMAVRKHFLLLALRSGSLSVDSAVNHRDESAALLKEFDERTHTEVQAELTKPFNERRRIKTGFACLDEEN